MAQLELSQLCQPYQFVAVSCESGYWKFEKWKVKWKSGSLISRSEKWNENLVHSFREWKVKWKCLDIEIESEKWNENVSKSRSRVKSELKMPRDRDREVKFLENFREILENQEIKKISIFLQMLFILQTFTLEYNKMLFLNQYITGDFGDGPWFFINKNRFRKENHH